MPVKEDAYKIAEIMNGNLEKGGKRIYTQDDFEEQLALAFREHFGIDNVWEISDDNGIAKINDKDIDLQEFENDVRGILSIYGWATIFEGDYEGGVTNCVSEASFNLNKWSATYETIDGFRGEVIVTAFNKVMAYDVFEDIAKDFDCDVAYLDIIRVSDDYEIE